MTDLGSVAGTTYSRADFINSSTQVVGGTWNCESSMFDGFVWESGSMVDLDTVLATSTTLHIYWAPFISENGEIAAFALTPDLQAEVYARLGTALTHRHRGFRARPIR